MEPGLFIVVIATVATVMVNYETQHDYVQCRGPRTPRITKHALTSSKLWILELLELSTLKSLPIFKRYIVYTFIGHINHYIHYQHIRRIDAKSGKFM
jgi:hypothetical protein